MTTWFISRHTGAMESAKRKNLVVDRFVPYHDPAQVQPAELRGRELSADEMERLGVRVSFAGTSGKTQGKDKNEIDVAFLYRNTLHLIECKTANLAQAGHGDDSKATEAIYKMESLLKFGGLRTRGMVIDYRGELAKSEANQKRAAEAGIAIVSGSQLKDLKGAISRLWLSARQ